MRLRRLAAALLFPLAVGACKHDDLGRPPADNTVTLTADVSADLGEKLVFLLARLPGFESLGGFSSFASFFLSLTGNRVSNVQVTTNLGGALGQQSYQAVAVTLAYRNAPAGTPPAPGGIVAFRASAAGQPYTEFAYAFGPEGSGALPSSGTGGLSVVAGTQANGYAGTQSWVADNGSVSLGQGAGTDACPNSSLLALAAPGVTCTTRFFPGSFSITNATPVAPATGTKQAALPGARIIGVSLAIDCNVSTLC
jgi:hypothetical protein